MESNEVQLEPPPNPDIELPSFNTSTVSQVITTEREEEKQKDMQQGQQSNESKPKKRITLANIIKFLFSVVAVVGGVALVLKWQETSTEAVQAVSRTYNEGVIELNQTSGKKYSWIKQKLDHFEPSDERTFYQRIFISNEGGNSFKSTQPVFLYLPGLNVATTIQASTLLNRQVKERRGIALALETRYFGESKPFGQESYTLPNLKYLALQQITEDVASAIQRIIDNHFFGITQHNQWIINGGLISGTIAAWVRAKYPALTVGAIASSPYLPVPVAPLASEAIYESVESGGKKCKLIIQKLRKNFEEELADDRREALIYSIGQGVELTTEEVLYFFQMRIKQLGREVFIFNCHPAAESKFLEKVRKFVIGQEESSYDPLTLSQQTMASTDQWHYYEAVRTARALEYIRCTQLGLFEIASNKSIAPSYINETFFRKRCSYIFGEDLWPDAQPVLEEYQPYMSTATNLLLVHGYYSTSFPYALNSSSPRTETIVAKCNLCNEIFDFQGDGPKFEAIEKTLAKERELLDRWLKK